MTELCPEPTAVSRPACQKLPRLPRLLPESFVDTGALGLQAGFGPPPTDPPEKARTGWDIGSIHLEQARVPKVRPTNPVTWDGPLDLLPTSWLFACQPGAGIHGAARGKRPAHGSAIGAWSPAAAGSAPERAKPPGEAFSAWEDGVSGRRTLLFQLWRLTRECGA